MMVIFSLYLDKDPNSLIQEYADLLSNDSFGKAASTKERLSNLIKEQHNTSGLELHLLAEQCQKSKKFLNAILFYGISADFFVKHCDGHHSWAV